MSRKWHFEGDKEAKEKSVIIREVSRALGSRAPPSWSTVSDRQLLKPPLLSHPLVVPLDVVPYVCVYESSTYWYILNKKRALLLCVRPTPISICCYMWSLVQRQHWCYDVVFILDKYVLMWLAETAQYAWSLMSVWALNGRGPYIELILEVLSFAPSPKHTLKWSKEVHGSGRSWGVEGIGTVVT